MTIFVISKIVCVFGGGFASGQAFKAIQNKSYTYAGFLLFIALANLVILGRY